MQTPVANECELTWQQHLHEVYCFNFRTGSRQRVGDSAQEIRFQRSRFSQLKEETDFMQPLLLSGKTSRLVSMKQAAIVNLLPILKPLEQNSGVLCALWGIG